MDTAYFLVFFVLLLLVKTDCAGGQSIGVCYGMVADNLPPPEQVIQLYKANNIRRMRLYNPNPDALQALRGSGIHVLLGVPNESLEELSSSHSAAASWVKNNILAHYPDVKFNYIAVGNEEMPSSNAHFILGAMQNIHGVLQSGGLDKSIKVSTAVHMVVLKQSYPPSIGAFRDELLPFLEPIVQFQAATGAPFLANVYPYFSHVGDPGNVPLPYALFASTSVVVRDGELGYWNLFDAMVDALYSALERVGGRAVEVVVAESGWPSAGESAATIENAFSYNQNLIHHVGEGTPKRPGKAVETYLFALFNENLKQPPGVEQNFGLFYPDQKPVYPITLP